MGGASLAGRRWGPTAGGWLLGIPWTSGPVAYFLALDHGSSFAAAAAHGMLAATLSQAAFCVPYARVASAGWAPAMSAGCLGFAACTALLGPLESPLAWTLALVLAGLLISLALVPRRDPAATAAMPSTAPSWDLPLRVVVATSLVLALTAAAPRLGPWLSGLLSPFPVLGAVLTVSAQRREGPAAAVDVLRGLLFGLFAATGFFTTLAALLDHLPVAGAFLAAAVVALSCQVIGLVLGGNRQRRAVASRSSGSPS